MLSNALFQRALLLPVLAGLLLWAWASWTDRPIIPSSHVIEQEDPEPLLGPKKQFIESLAAIVAEENQAVLRERKWLLKLSEQAQISPSDEERLRKAAKLYRVEDPDNAPKLLIRDLLVRVDTVPISLAIAQAALESAWGRSRFAREGKNLFGIWCYEPGCGLVPKRRNKDATHEVTAYPDVSGSVRDYIHSLNSHSAYAMLRELRSTERKNGNPITASSLTPGLTKYSAIGTQYVDRIESIVFANDLERFDRVVYSAR
ncbi:MAG: glucosaminidase domain-containing protein [Gammaproteobacteria bacterium]